jgi:hypothetical protein
MRRFRFLLVLLVLLVVAAMPVQVPAQAPVQAPVQAEDQVIREIRSYYNKISSEITRCNHSAELSEQQDSTACRLYLVEISENQLNAPVAVVGIYQRTIRRWYDLSCSSETEGNGYEPKAQTLVRIEIKGQRSAVNWYEEYLYKGGKPLFYFRKSDFGEYRYYFDNDALVQFTEKGRPEDFEDDRYSMQQKDWRQVLNDARCQQQTDLSADACSD